MCIYCIEQLVDSFTINQAYANFIKHECGSLEVGKSADLIVVDRNIFLGKPGDIALAKIEQLFLEENLFIVDKTINRLMSAFCKN